MHMLPLASWFCLPRCVTCDVHRPCSDTDRSFPPCFLKQSGDKRSVKSWSPHVTWANTVQIWCDFDCASSLICGNKMPTRCNRGFYCRSYCLLNMFRASLFPSSGAQEYYTVVAACGISCWCGSILQTGRITLSSTPDQLLEKPQHEIPQAATTV